MAHKPVGSGVSFVASTVTATSGIMTHFTDTVRITPLTNVHVTVGANPTATISDYYVTANTSATLSIGRPKSQKVIGVTTGTTTTIDFPAGSGSPFEVGDEVQLTGIVPAGPNGGTSGIGLTVLSVLNGSFSRNSNGDPGFFSTRLTLAHNTTSVGPITDGEGELRDVFQVAAVGTASGVYVQQVQITGVA